MAVAAAKYVATKKFGLALIGKLKLKIIKMHVFSFLGLRKRKSLYTFSYCRNSNGQKFYFTKPQLGL